MKGLNSINKEVLPEVDLSQLLEGSELQDPITVLEDEFKQNHCGKFTASENWKLVEGCATNEEEWVEVLATKNRLYPKKWLIEKAKELKLQGKDIPEFNDKNKNRDIAEEIGKYLPIVNGWSDTAKSYILEKADERVTGELSKTSLEHLDHIKWARENEVQGVMAIREHFKIPGLAHTGNDQKFHPFCNAKGEVIGGATPDGDGDFLPIGFEVKCPDTKNHDLLRLGEFTIIDGENGFEWEQGERLTADNFQQLKPDWYWQIITGFACPDCADWHSWYFGTFDPRHPHSLNAMEVARKGKESHVDLMKQRMLQADILCEMMVEIKMKTA